MERFRLAENITALRRGKNITQEQLAAFLGVTKASVSKWENRQSLPDLVLVPQIAAFFGVSIDELLGYAPQLSKGQIKETYQALATGFAKKPFVEALEDSRAVVHRYYSCYPLLYNICLLWLNHIALAPTPEAQKALLCEAKALCDHILDGCQDSTLCENTRILRAYFDLLLGDAEATIAALEPLVLAKRLNLSGDTLLIQAYIMAGAAEKARRGAQATLYLQLLSLLSTSTQYLALAEPVATQATMARVAQLIELYELRRLHPNSVAQWEFQAAAVCLQQGQADAALQHLEGYCKAIRQLFTDGLQLHGDAYFDCLDDWLSTLELETKAPRDSTLVAADALAVLKSPLFAAVSQRPEFLRLQAELERSLPHATN